MIKRAAVLLSLSAALASCSGGSNGSPDAGVDSFDRRGMFQNLATNVVLPTYRSFSE